MTIPGISKIYFLNTSDLPPFLRHFPDNFATRLPVIPNLMDFSGVPLFSYSQSAEPASHLEFFSESLLRNAHYAFIAVDMHHRNWLIGALEPPFPKIEIEASTADFSGKAGFSYKISWPNLPVKCIF